MTRPCSAVPATVAVPRHATCDVLRATAIAYTQNGWHVFPLAAKRRPLVRWGTRATRDPRQIEQWWRRWPEAWIGLATGPSGLLVVDLDGTGAARRWQTMRPTSVPTTAVRTPRGWHLYFAGDGPTSVGVIASGVDTRGRGGFVIAPPSPGYRWHDGYSALAPVPSWLQSMAYPGPLHLIERHTVAKITTPYVAAAVVRETAAVREAANGTRNTRLNRAAANLAQLLGPRLDEATLRRALMAAASDAGLSDREAFATIASGVRWGRAHPRVTRALG